MHIEVLLLEAYRSCLGHVPFCVLSHKFREDGADMRAASWVVSGTRGDESCEDGAGFSQYFQTTFIESCH